MEETIELELELDKETDLAYIVSDGEGTYSLPKSQCSLEHIKDNLYMVTLPEWLAEREGLV